MLLEKSTSNPKAPSRTQLTILVGAINVMVVGWVMRKFGMDEENSAELVGKVGEVLVWIAAFFVVPRLKGRE